MACAEASMGGGDGLVDGGDDVSVDAYSSPWVDAAPVPDATHFADGSTTSFPDASLPPPDGGMSGDALSGLSCMVNEDCTVAGECCFVLGGIGICVAGTELPTGDCLPDL